MTRIDPLDRPLTRRELIEALESSSSYDAIDKAALVDTLSLAVEKTTDFVRVAAPGRDVVKIVNQPQRRVQVGDLVTIPSVGTTLARPRVRRVVEINVDSTRSFLGNGVAIAPDDAERIESALGKVA